MASSPVLKLLDESPAERIREYLIGGGMPAEIIDWKYYDKRFNHGRPRGCVCLRDEKVVGFLGLIPFRDINRRIEEAAWCCDWSVDPSQGGGVGIMLIKKAQGLYRSLFAIEGSDITRQLFPRFATSTLPQAAVRMQLNLRVGAYIEKVSNRWAGVGGWVSPLGKIPLRYVKNISADSRISIDRGVSPKIGPLLEELGKSSYLPVYDLDYLQWQLERCPVVRCNTCYFSPNGACEAAVVYWQSTLKSYWRIAIWALKPAWDVVPEMLLKVIREIQKNHGMHVSVIVPYADGALIEIAKQCGFSRWADDIPSYALTSPRGTPAPRLSHFSYVDCDLAYRF